MFLAKELFHLLQMSWCLNEDLTSAGRLILLKLVVQQRS
jgi:hypothetical protein